MSVFPVASRDALRLAPIHFLWHVLVTASMDYGLHIRLNMSDDVKCIFEEGLARRMFKKVFMVCSYIYLADLWDEFESEDGFIFNKHQSWRT